MEIPRTEEEIHDIVFSINDECDYQDQYIEHDDNLNSIGELFEKSAIHYGEIGRDYYDDVTPELKASIIKQLEGMDCSDIWDYCEFNVHYGINCVMHEIWSVNVGEIEVDLSEIKESFDFKTLSDSEIKEIERQCEYYVQLKRGYAYIDLSYERYSLVLDVDRLIIDFNLTEGE